MAGGLEDALQRPQHLQRFAGIDGERACAADGRRGRGVEGRVVAAQGGDGKGVGGPGGADPHSGTETVGIVQGYISRGFDAVFVCSAAPADTMQALYEKGSAEGVNFYQFNSTEELANPSQAEDPTGGLHTVSNVGYDDRWQSGYIAGQYIAEKLDGEGSVIQIMGPSGSDWTKLRQLGFEKALAEYPGIEIVGQGDGGYVRDKGFTAAQDLLTKYPDVDAVYGENEDMALGASQAIDAAGLKHWDGRRGSSPSAPTAWSPAWSRSRPASSRPRSTSTASPSVSR